MLGWGQAEGLGSPSWAATPHCCCCPASHSNLALQPGAQLPGPLLGGQRGPSPHCAEGYPRPRGGQGLVKIEVVWSRQGLAFPSLAEAPQWAAGEPRPCKASQEGGASHRAGLRSPSSRAPQGCLSGPTAPWGQRQAAVWRGKRWLSAPPLSPTQGEATRATSVYRVSINTASGAQLTACRPRGRDCR